MSRSITLKCPLGRVLLLPCPHFSCMLGTCESRLLRKNMYICSLFSPNHNTDNAHTQRVCVCGCTKSTVTSLEGVKRASFFLRGPTVHSLWSITPQILCRRLQMGCKQVMKCTQIFGQAEVDRKRLRIHKPIL